MAPTPPPLRARLALAGAGLVFALAMAEGGLRFMGPLGPEFILDGTTSFYDPSLFEEDPVLLTRLAPNVVATIRTVEGSTSVRTNGLGLRGPSISPKAPGTMRVLALGDSFTLGLQVAEEDTWAAQLARRLTDDLGRPVEVWNAGVSGYGIEQSTLRMRELAGPTAADAAVLLVYLGNDLRDNVRYPERRKERANLPPVPPVPPAPPVLRNWLRGIARWSRLAAYGVLWAQTANASDDPQLVEYRDEILPFVDKDRLESLLPATGRALQGFGAACTQLQLRCIVALAPPAYAVHTERLDRTLAAFDLDGRDADLTGPGQAIAALVPQGMPVIDLTGPLKAASSRSLYLTFDPHWSVEGHAVATAALTDPVAKLLRQPGVLR